MDDNIVEGMRVLMPGGVFSAHYVVVKVQRIDGDTIIGLEVSPNEETREVQAMRDLVLTTARFSRRDRGAGVVFAKDETVLQKVPGGYQIVSPIADVVSSDSVVLVRTYTHDSSGNVMGLNTSSPVNLLVDPATVL